MSIAINRTRSAVDQSEPSETTNLLNLGNGVETVLTSKSHKFSNEIILFIAFNLASGRGNPVSTNFNKR